MQQNICQYQASTSSSAASCPCTTLVEKKGNWQQVVSVLLDDYLSGDVTEMVDFLARLGGIRYSTEYAKFDNL